MPVDSKHAEYEANYPDWKRCRDTIAGEHAVVAEADLYLPVPPGMRSSKTVQTDLNTQTPINATNQSVGSYENYRSFAEFPELVGPQVNGIQGLVHSTELEFELPDRMQYLLESATPDGMAMSDLWELITREIFSVGRVNLLGEVVAESDDVKLCLYTTESLINWREGEKADGTPLQMAVLEETTSQPKEDDPFEEEEIVRWRELVLDEAGRYAVRRWEKHGDEDPVVVGDSDTDEEWVYPEMMGGGAFESIPLWPINAVDTGFHYGTIPVIGTARRALAIYRKSADYNRALHIKCDPQLVIFGIEPNERPTRIGGGTCWSFTNPDASAMYIDIDGQGIPLVRDSIRDEYERIAAESGRMIDSNKEQNNAESGEAIRRRQSFQLVTVTSVVINAAAALEQVLRGVGEMLGLEESAIEGITVTPDLSFTESGMGFKDLIDAYTAKTMGAPLSDIEIREYMVNHGLMTKDYETVQEEINNEAPRIDPSVAGAGAGDEDSIVDRVFSAMATAFKGRGVDDGEQAAGGKASQE